MARARMRASVPFFFFFFFSLTSLHSGSLSMHSRSSPLNRMFCYGYQVLSWTADEARRSIFTASRSRKPINLLEALWQNRNIVFTPCRMESLECFSSVCVPVSVLLWFMCKLMDFNIHKGLPADSSLWVPPLNQCHDNMSRMFIVKKSLEISSQQWREHSSGVVDIVLCVTGLYYCPQAAEMLHWAPDTSTRNTQNSIFLKLFWYYMQAHVAVLFCFVFSV